MSHTPGPWHVREHGQCADMSVLSKDGGDIADCDFTHFEWPVKRTREECMANAQLISAAPEMLATLKHIKEFSDLFCTACERERLIDVIPAKSIHAPKCQEITEAIAKAEKENNNEQ